MTWKEGGVKNLGGDLKDNSETTDRTLTMQRPPMPQLVSGTEFN